MAIFRAKASFALHKNDWCHVCGFRVKRLVDVSYPENAEHPHGDVMEYFRVCSDCISAMKLVVEED